MKVAGCRAAL